MSAEIIAFPAASQTAAPVRRTVKEEVVARDRVTGERLEDSLQIFGMWVAFGMTGGECRPAILRSVSLIRTMIRDQWNLLRCDHQVNL